jgi:adenylate kinase
VAGFYALVLDDPAGGVLIGLGLVLAALLVVRAVQSADAKDWRLQHDADHARDRRDLEAIRDHAEATRAAAVQAASERSAEVTVLSDYRRDHERHHARLEQPAVPGQRTDGDVS